MAKATTGAPPELLQADRDRFRGMLDELAGAIESGECTPTRDELRALAEICEEKQLPAEAARVRRWMGES